MEASTDDNRLIDFMRRQLERGDVSSGELFVAIKTRYPKTLPEQIERCAMQMVANLNTKQD